MNFSSLLYYCPTSPSGLRWKVKRGKKSAGDVAGSLYNTGYWVVNTGGSGYCAHRIIAELHGLLESGSQLEVDHIDRDKSNNHISNLRVVTHRQNMRNLGLRKSNSTGISGVRWDKSRNKWIADISINNRSSTIGRFDNLLGACCARKRKELQYAALN